MKAKWMVGAALSAVTLCGGAVAAGDYPPDDPTATTVTVGGVSAIADPADPADPALAATGSDSDTTVKIAGGAVVAGVGLLAAARLRRRSAAT